MARLPSYFSKLRNLDILKADRNPIEWPPKAVMEPQGGLNSAQGMKDWIRSLQKWLETNNSKTELATTNNKIFPNDQLRSEGNL